MTPEIQFVREGSFARVKPSSFLGGELWESYRQATAGVRFDRSRRVSLAPLDKVPAILARLRRGGFGVRMDPELRIELQKRTADQWMQLQAVRERIDSIGREFEARTGNRFFPYQHTGATWLSMKHTCLLADDMGLGKTMQAIVALPSNAPTLVVCPASIKGVWRSEVERWRPHIRVVTLAGRGSFRWPEPGEMVVTNYDVLPSVHDTKRCDGFLPAERCEGCDERVTFNKNGIAVKDMKGHASTCKGFQERRRCPGCHPMLEDVRPGTVGIADEVHKIKHSTSKRTISCRALFESVRNHDGRTWGLTGTPIENSPQELWNVLAAVGASSEAYGSWKDFLRLANARPKTFGRGDNSRSYGFEWGDPDDEFIDRLRRVSLRRMKRDVLPQLPTKMWRRMIVDVDRKTIAACDRLLKRKGNVDELEALLEKGTGEDFEMLATLRRALASAKVPSLLKLVEEYEEAQEPVVVFSMHREPIDHLGKRRGWETITGDVDPKKRSEIVARFQDGELKGLACTIQSAGEGLTLTRSNQALFIDLSYKPTANEQAEDRFVRIGQTRGVVVTILEADHPIDRRVNDLLTKKRKIIAASVDASKVVEDGSASVSTFEQQLREVQEDVAAGRAVRRMPEGEEERQAIEALHVLEFDSADERLAMDLAEQADVIGLSDRQWSLAVDLSKRGREYERGEVGSTEDGSRAVAGAEAEETSDDPVPKGDDRLTGRVIDTVRDLDPPVNVHLGTIEGGEMVAPKSTDPLDPVMKAIHELSDEDRRDLFEEIEEIYCVSCGEDTSDLDDEDEHDCPFEDEDEDEGAPRRSAGKS